MQGWSCIRGQQGVSVDGKTGGDGSSDVKGCKVGQPRKGSERRKKDKKKESQRKEQEEEWVGKWSPVSRSPSVLV